MKITNLIIGTKFDPLTSRIWSVVAFPEIGKAPLPHQRYPQNDGLESYRIFFFDDALNLNLM